MEPVCPVCRAALYASKSIIPNFALDNLVQKHIAILTSKGIADWQPGAERRKEWQERADKWTHVAVRKRESLNARNARTMAFRAEAAAREREVLIRPPSPVADVRTVLGLD